MTDPSFEARRALYDLLGRIFLRPADAALLDVLRELPGFAEHVPLEASGLEELQVAYERIFGRNVYPYESLYRDRELMLNSAAAERAARLYAAHGMAAVSGAAGAADHLGLELGFMSFLLSVEATAQAAGDAAAIAHAQTGQAGCLHEHLALWAPIWARTLFRLEEHGLYQVSAELTVELLLSDLANLPAPPTATTIPLQPAAGLQAQRTPTGNESTEEEALQPDGPYAAQRNSDDEQGLGRIVRQLLTPDEVGLFLCRNDMTRLGRELEVPLTIGDRFQMLRGLFEGAGQFAAVPPLLAALDGLLAHEHAALEALVAGYPSWQPQYQHWRVRLERGQALIGELRNQAAELA